jgi:glycyl-tRNA synthetase
LPGAELSFLLLRQGIIANETLAYFIGRTYLFMLSIGVTDNRMRFRQHLKHEMAHYAADCWDAEVECSYGWVECAGLADRSAYDLQARPAGNAVNSSSRAVVVVLKASYGWDVLMQI